MQTKLNHVCGVLLISTIVFGAAQFIMAAQKAGQLDVPKTSKDFWEGRTTLTLEKQLDHKLPARDTLIAWANAVRYKLFSGGGDQVRVGRDGWLFLTDEIKYEGQKSFSKPVDAQALMDTRLDLIRDASKALSAQGVSLVVALVPDKARVYAPYLEKGVYPAHNQARYAAGLEGLKERGVAVVDLYGPLGQAAQAKAATAEPVYYKTDTHWNQAGAELSAKEISRTVAVAKLELAPSAFATKASGPVAGRSGDLIRLMGLEHMPAALRPAVDQEAPQVTEAVGAAPSGGLFGDAAVPVVLTGTSYSMRGNFHGHLQQALSAKVLNMAKDGGGFLQAMTDYLKDDAFKQSKPKLIVWELPERMLRLPLDGEKDWLARVGLKP
jgi:alginate O-acetyltransferase complex protein AlgJ